VIEYEKVAVLPELLRVMFELEVVRANPEPAGPMIFDEVVVVGENHIPYAKEDPVLDFAETV
jgi:hypothetical protein